MLSNWYNKRIVISLAVTGGSAVLSDVSSRLGATATSWMFTLAMVMGLFNAAMFFLGKMLDPKE